MLSLALLLLLPTFAGAVAYSCPRGFYKAYPDDEVHDNWACGYQKSCPCWEKIYTPPVNGNCECACKSSFSPPPPCPITDAPTTRRPTRSPTTLRPTSSPTGAPTPRPTPPTSRPTSSPTGAPTLPPYNHDTERCDANPFEKRGYYSGMTLRRDNRIGNGFNQTKFCKDSPELATTTDLANSCAQFCPEDSYPILIGTAGTGQYSGAFGAWFDVAAKMISDLMYPTTSESGEFLKSFSIDDYRSCLLKREYTHSMKAFASKFGKLKEELVIEVRVFRQAVRKLTADISQMIADNEDVILGGDPARKPETIVGLFKDSFANFATHSRQRLIDKMKDLADSKEDLVENFKEAIGEIETFMTECASKKWPPYDSKLQDVGDVMSDLCTLSGSYCFNSRYMNASHASCGCLVDLTTGMGTLTAKSPLLLLRDTQQNHTIDVCAESRLQAASYVDPLLATLDPVKWAEYQAALKTKYGKFYCTRDQSGVGSGPPPSPVPNPIHTLAQQRRLLEGEGQEELSSGPCLSEPLISLGYPSFFKLSKSAEDPTAFCGSNSKYDTDAEIQQICQDFCPDGALPLPLGLNSGFGLSLDDTAKVVSMLLDPSGSSSPSAPGYLKTYDQTDMNTCEQQMGSYNEILSVFSQVVQGTSELDWAMLKYRYQVRTAIANAVDKLNSPEVKSALQKCNARDPGPEGCMQILRDIAKGTLEDSEQSKNDLSQKIHELKDDVNEFQSALDIQLDQLKKFVNGCAVRWFPPADNNIIKDICVVQGDVCVETQYTQHITCGCLVNLGSSLGDLSSNSSSSLTASSSSDHVYDACAEARQASAPYIDMVRTTLGDSDLLTKYEASMQETYGSNYCPWEPTTPPTPLTPQPTPQPTKKPSSDSTVLVPYHMHMAMLFCVALFAWRL